MWLLLLVGLLLLLVWLLMMLVLLLVLLLGRHSSRLLVHLWLLLYVLLLRLVLLRCLATWNWLGFGSNCLGLRLWITALRCCSRAYANTSTAALHVWVTA